MKINKDTILNIYLHVKRKAGVFHKSNDPLITYPAYATFVIVLIFFVASVSKGLLSLNLNEIGDSLAGFAGTLAFLWIIVTVLLQNKDLKLQYAEIKDMKIASESQARSLRSAEIFKAMEYIDLKLERIEPRIEQCRVIINEEIKQFIDTFDTGRNPGAPFDPRKDIIEMWGYFKKTESENEVFYPFESVREDLDFLAYLKLETVSRNMKYVLDALDKLTKNADNEIKDEINDLILSWEQLLMISWYREWKPRLDHLELVVKKAIVQYKIGNEIARAAVAWSLESEGSA